jgi:hypothetical protein
MSQGFAGPMYFDYVLPGHFVAKRHWDASRRLMPLRLKPTASKHLQFIDIASGLKDIVVKWRQPASR